MNGAPPFSSDVTDQSGRFTRPWTVWLSNLWVQTNSVSGPTSERPTKDLYVGKKYIDLTLGKPIWLASVRPTVWKDYNGTTV